MDLNEGGQRVLGLFHKTLRGIMVESDESLFYVLTHEHDGGDTLQLALVFAAPDLPLMLQFARTCDSRRS